MALNNLAMFRAELDNWAEAARSHRRAARIVTGGRNGGRLAKAALARNWRELRAAARAVRRAGGDSAKARALLVSHWYVSSTAAVKLTTKAFAELRANPGIGRAGALQHAMRTLVQSGEDHEVHPAYWAPFVVVGEGAR